MERIKVRMTVEKIPWNYTCDGEDISPGIELGDVNAQWLALVVLDASSSEGGGFPHWLMWNVEAVSIIPEKIPKEATVSFPIAAVQGTNGFGKIGYNGPCPKPGEAHRYDVKVYGLDTKIDLSPGATKKELIGAMEGHVIQYGEIAFVYAR
jgi:Raf kinase inhibitor-like YbhB/YbcL family protein